MTRVAKVIALVCVPHMLSHAYFLVVPTLFPLLMAALDLSYTDLGLALTAFGLAAGLGQVQVGFVVDWLGGRRLLIVGMAVQGTAIALIGPGRRLLADPRPDGRRRARAHRLGADADPAGVVLAGDMDVGAAAVIGEPVIGADQAAAIGDPPEGHRRRLQGLRLDPRRDHPGARALRPGQAVRQAEKGCLAPAPATGLETHPQSLKSAGADRNARADSTA